MEIIFMVLDCKLVALWLIKLNRYINNQSQDTFGSEALYIYTYIYIHANLLKNELTPKNIHAKYNSYTEICKILLGFNGPPQSS